VRVTIIGGGAIGGTTGVLLHQAGHDVVLVDRDQSHVDEINRNGFRLSGLHTIEAKLPAVTPEQLQGIVEEQGPLDIVILAVKAMDTAGALAQVTPLLSPDGVVISYQNGLIEPIIAEHIGAERTIGAFIHFGADLHGPGHVVVSDRYPTYLSELDGVRTPRIERLAELLSAVTDVHITDNLPGFLWGKLSWAAMGFVAATVDAPTDEVVMQPEAREVIRGAVAEVVDVAHAQGIRLENIHGFEPNFFDRNNPDRIAQTDALLDEWAAQGKHAIKRYTGIHRDIKVRKRRTEVDFQLVPVIEKGAELDVPTPILSRVVEIIHQIESGERQQDWAAIAELLEVTRSAS
jgi:2-dehydropantoate 2-reductase